MILLYALICIITGHPLWHYYDMHTPCVIICIICHNHAIKYYLSLVPHHIEHTLFHVMHYYYTIITFMTHLYILWHANFAKCRQNRRGNQRKMHVGAQTVGIMKAKSPRVCISSLCQWHGLRVHGISTWCTNGIAVSTMTVHARPRPKFSTTIRAFEAQGNRQLFPAPRNPSARTPAHTVMPVVRHQSRALIVTRWQTWFDCKWNCQYNIENSHRPIHIAGWINGMVSLSS